jgi:putative transposase
VHPTQVSAWKRQALESLSAFFEGGLRGEGPELKRQESERFEQIGRLKMELEWLKKSTGGFALEHRRQLIGSDAKLSLSKQCELLGVGRSGWYCQSRGESAENLALRRALDGLYTRWPFYGVRRRTLAVQQQGWAVNPKRARPESIPLSNRVRFTHLRPQTRILTAPIWHELPAARYRH